ncbi:MAG: S-layer homology domain-containing protein [Oscillibacter sp.]|nr:S-layer homology domain-containing protein [Oscillibacter sp.]
MKNDYLRRAAVLILAGLILSGSASALFGKKTEPAAEGAPTVRDITVKTYRDIPYSAQFLGSDAEGEDMTFAVVDQPRKGTVTIDGVNFVYTPNEGVTGGDSFTYAATDSAGNTSVPATVTVTIQKTKSGVTYADTDAKSACAAQELAEAGIFTGSKIGEKWYFEPEEAVSRSEFLAMTMEMSGRNVTTVTMTGFTDDAAIPTWAKAYAAAGVADGIVQGSAAGGGVAFRSEEPITFNEAAAILNRVLEIENVDLEVWYADRESVPTWAAQAVGNLEAVSVLQAGSFGSPVMEEAVTRADAARMLSSAGALLDGETSPFDWLK